MIPVWWLSAEDAADVAGVTLPQVRSAWRAGKLARGRGQQGYGYRREDVERWASSLTPPFELIPPADLRRLTFETAMATDVTGRSRAQTVEEGGKPQPISDRTVVRRFRCMRRLATVAAGQPRQPRELRVLQMESDEWVVPGLPEGDEWTWTPVGSIPDLKPEDFHGLLLWAAAQSVAAGVKALELHWTVDHFIGLADLRRHALLGQCV